VLLNTRLGCNVHFSSFITRQQMDAPYLLRLVQQVKRFLPVDVEE
jgi:hypothetical protein